ncbi:MAG: hypothetical protein LH610_09695 [Sphingomonas bacterium]|nr:hypothetical protein [Sphingomonas bacterium]
MNKYFLAGALATLAIPSVASAAPEAPIAPMTPDQHEQMPKKDGCCPEKKDGEKQDNCCKGMKCCNKMKPADKDTAAPDAHAGHQMTH